MLPQLGFGGWVVREEHPSPALPFAPQKGGGQKLPPFAEGKGRAGEGERWSLRMTTRP